MPKLRQLDGARPERGAATGRPARRDGGRRLAACLIVLAAGAAAAVFGATHTPEAFLFDRAGKPIAAAETKSIGCSLKLRPRS